MLALRRPRSIELGRLSGDAAAVISSYLEKSRAAECDAAGGSPAALSDRMDGDDKSLPIGYALGAPALLPETHLLREI